MKKTEAYQATDGTVHTSPKSLTLHELTEFFNEIQAGKPEGPYNVAPQFLVMCAASFVMENPRKIRDLLDDYLTEVHK